MLLLGRVHRQLLLLLLLLQVLPSVPKHRMLAAVGAHLDLTHVGGPVSKSCIAEVRRPGVVAGHPLAGVVRHDRPAGLRAVAHALTSRALLVPRGVSLPVPEPGVDLPKGRPSRGDLVPTLYHEGIHPRWAIFRARQQLSGSDHLNHFLVAVAIIRLQPVTVNFPQHHSK